MEIDGQLWRMSKEGEDQAMMPYLIPTSPINLYNLSCVHRIMSYNASAFHHLGVINPILSSLTSQ